MAWMGSIRMEELLPLLRRLWRLHEGPIEHDGHFYRLHVKPTAPPRPPLRTDTPIFMAGVNARGAPVPGPGRRTRRTRCAAADCRLPGVLGGGGP